MPVTVDQHGRVAVVTLVDHARRNAMGAAMVDEIVAAFDRLEADESVGAAVVTGAPPAFCSGADLSDLGRIDDDADERGSIVSIYEGFLRVLRSPLPTVAAVNGPAVGAGLNLALACDVRLAGEQARFDSRFLRIGIHPGGGHTWLLERLVGPQTAAAMVLFGQALGADEAVATGLAWAAFADADLLAAAVDLAAGGASAPRPLSQRAKATLRRVPWQPDFDAAVAFEVAHQTWSFDQPYFAEAARSRAARRVEPAPQSGRSDRIRPEHP